MTEIVRIAAAMPAMAPIIQAESPTSVPTAPGEWRLIGVMCCAAFIAPADCERDNSTGFLWPVQRQGLVAVWIAHFG